MSNPVSLRIYGTSLRVSGQAPRALEGLARDFARFSCEPGPADVELFLHARPPSGLPPEKGRLALATPRYRAYDDGPRRLVVYADGETALYDYEAERGWLFCADEDRLHELAYLLLLSRLGERLDARGLHRVHALGFELKGEGGLLILPSGGGKTTVGYELLRRSGARMLSDDTPLLGADLVLRPFPLRWGFRADADLSGVPPELVRPFPRRHHGLKRLVDTAFMGDRVAGETPLKWLILGRPGGARAELEPAGPAAALAALAPALVVGWGVPQMAEWALRPSALPRLAGTALRRLGAAVAAARRARVLRLSLGPCPKAAADAVASLA